MATESRVLVIFCGGTIGMLKSEKHGYVPEPFYLTETLRAQTRFHDPLEDSLFSHSRTVQGYREWSRSGRSSPLHVPTPNNPDLNQIGGSHLQTLLVRSSRPIMLPKLPNFRVGVSCKKVSDDLYESQLPSLVTPRGNGPRIRYAVLEWDPLLDSSNLGPSDWVRIATEIELNYNFDAFVILHGTDTMAYTSSALSFLLEDLGKTVILTGAQIPLSEWRNDAVDNLLGALCIAGQYIIPECCVFFNHTLYRGNRISKSSILDLDAFSSPNFPPLMNVGIDVVVNWNEVLRQPKPRKFRAHKPTLRLFPGITATAVRAFLSPPIEGIILETFGSGNAPNRPELLQVLQEACDRGVVAVAISQCAKGTVSDSYQTGRALIETGVVPGGDMTPECALTKLAYLLSKPELTPEKVRQLMQAPLRGELTVPHPLVEDHVSVDGNVESVNGLLSLIIRVSSSQSTALKTIPTGTKNGNTSSTAPWTWTNSEALGAESALLPLLIHLAAARNDIEAISWCIKSTSYSYGDVTAQSVESTPAVRAAGIVNCLDAASGRSPLHVAALLGNSEAAFLLLDAGALVHVRDMLDHTALYYAARQKHEDIVERIVETGGLLAGSDTTGGFVSMAVSKAQKQGDQSALRIWLKAGAKLDDHLNISTAQIM
ncbi:hypothetical protein M422DRAFT_192238 [Sphaerobolus stellatus SS14]|uniref:asparaginase n=1 Tax=Sphaerobolus stellatus (strain SS14) TaxID=990650 RepID=A0A0C9UBI5_SPHS4|nr:hypothetical protein M422DRAFT_192238 [Sphaerobolus stellatus SS14]